MTPTLTHLGSTASVLVRGEGGADKLSGKGGPGFSGALDISMTIEGGGGKDLITGGVKADILHGEGGDDRVSGGEGRDEFFVKGGGTDRVKCGADRDKVMADKSDKVAGDCERVST